MRTSNHLIGLLNFLTFLLSIPILAGGIWLSTRANNTDCMSFLQWPLIFIGVSIMVVSLAGIAGACYRNTFLMYLYLWAMFIIIAVLIGFIIFAYAVTDKGSGRPVLNRVYPDYYLQDYSGWLKDRVASDGYWGKIRSCIHDSKACAKTGRVVAGYPETADMYYLRKLNPIQSGCCKPPTECGYIYVNETVWNPVNSAAFPSNLDCNRWSNDQEQLCYNCDSCKAGVLGSLKKSWRKVSVINIVVLIILVIAYVIACAAFKNNKRMDNDEPYGATRMEKARPTRIHF
ncbi:putative tetraspanin/Peripherin [Helianthus annuus]|uniref:Putative tetraspanin3 n=1 Tax=Helianthus annuus TaxID=4232 RepID=A0A251SRC5_HELAN|nr:tetraspanin-3 isoform X1 [Helianthus annuus]KAF5773277.1 putative tetraspanin/Peripherin [Helianthus annuus]KAJ0497614.1 putative tetraspanin/Peripherin [Helianthus annuus]KAJ0663619.1 putative tetraspanin/Peripherin [Helianthus annuus]KAJ0671117.1 putative tetraspanin/Peripherin [Helianthus annuus]KAJ0849099.1 putative tetraspanin/Peripherin [Helianthus annuus]